MNDVAQTNVERPPPVGALLLYERALLQFYQQVDVCRFKRRHLNVLRTIRRRSFDLGQPVTGELNLRFFVEDNCFPASSFDASLKESKFDKSEASRGIDELEAMRVIMAPTSRRGCYGINVLWSAWLVTLKRDSERLTQGLFDLVPVDLANQLRKDFIEFGGCPPIMPLDREMDPVTRSVPVRNVGDSNAGVSMSSGEAAGFGGGCSQERSPASSTLPEKLSQPIGDSPHADTLGAQSVGKIPTVSDPLGAQSVGKIPTMPRKPDKHWAKSVGKIPTTAEIDAEATARPVSPRTPLTEQRVQVQIIPEQQAQGFVPERARASSVGKIPTALISWGEQRRLMEVIEGWVGAEDMRRNCKFWVQKVIRNVPWVVDVSVASLREQERLQPGYFKDHQHKIKVAVVDMAKRADVKSWSDLPPGPEPTEEA